jgi:hypothetical protein
MTSRFLITSAFSIALLAQFSSAASAATITLINDQFTSNPGTIGSSFQNVSGSGSFVNSSKLLIPQPTQFESINTFNFNAGDLVTLSFNYYDDGGTVPYEKETQTGSI